MTPLNLKIKLPSHIQFMHQSKQAKKEATVLEGRTDPHCQRKIGLLFHSGKSKNIFSVHLDTS